VIDLLTIPVGGNVGIRSGDRMYYWETRFVTTAFNAGIRQRIGLAHVGELNDRGANVNRTKAKRWVESMRMALRLSVAGARGEAKRLTAERTLLAGLRLAACYCTLEDRGESVYMPLSRAYMVQLLASDPALRDRNSMRPMHQQLISLISVNPGVNPVREVPPRGTKPVERGIEIPKKDLLYFLIAVGELSKDARVVNLTYQEREFAYGVRIAVDLTLLETSNHKAKFLYINDVKVIYNVTDRDGGNIVDPKSGAMFVEYEKRDGYALYVLTRPCFGVVPKTSAGRFVVEPNAQEGLDTWECHKWLDAMRDRDPTTLVLR